MARVANKPVEPLLSGFGAATSADNGGSIQALHESPEPPIDASETGIPARIDIETTFNAMARRRIRRQLGGTRKPALPNLTRAFWIVLYMSIGVGFVGLQGGFGDLELRVSIFRSTPTFVFFVLIVMVVWVAMGSYAVVRWCLTWLLLGTGLVLIIGNPASSGTSAVHPLPFAPLFEWGEDPPTQQVVIAVVTLSLVTMTLAVFFGFFYIYPMLVSALGRCRSISRLWGIRRVHREHHAEAHALDGQPARSRLEFTYAPLHMCSFLPWPLSCHKRRHFAYEGELGDDGHGCLVPHGWGTWTDTAKHGERLTGYWQLGRPVGPFRSLELRTGCAFTNLRIGVASNSAMAWNVKTCVPQLAQTLRWGVISVEVSVAGSWIKGLPAAELLAPLEEKDARWMLDQLGHVGQRAERAEPRAEHAEHATGTGGARERTPQSVVVSLGPTPDRLHVSGHQPTSAEPATSATITLAAEPGQAPSLRIDGGWRLGEVEQEVLIWIPGFNASSDVISIAVAQLLALGAFPSHIKPLVFSWPNGKELTYPLAETLARSEVMRKDVRELFRSVLEDGRIERIHVLVHSMGSQVFFNALPELVELLAAKGASLATCILLNADSPLEEFVDTSYPLLRRVCNHVTVYADTNDMGERVAKAPACRSFRGRRRCSAPCHLVSLVAALFYSRFISYLSECLPFVPDIATRTPLGRYPYLLYRESLDMERATTAAEAQQDWRQLRIELPVEYLDLDVVDTSTLDSNVHGMRHCYFNLNSFIVDDLAEIVTTRRRACMRRRLTATSGNVWAFLAAPGHVDEV